MNNQNTASSQLSNVSRETLDNLERYRDEVLRWNSAINLISRASEVDIWERHFKDSAQLARFYPSGPARWLDMGSGAGFPGMVLALMAAEMRPELTFTLVESDQRKCAFLRSVARLCDVAPEIVSERVDRIPAQVFDVISARALASLEKLFSMCHGFTNANTIMVFPKGAEYQNEIDAARNAWNFEVQSYPSATEADARILVIRNLSRG
ncbi:16S rRNA (guanine(527)-N(7))-methyltransferase RsmG [Oceaniglobus indicus]|uniref:16S rRNA (guanine(527)-N(7))-methyltransferase RsmG n=1 Tax=Oceaniglobus indicus TaxID=2047749 RepID=UPI000C19A5EB|nr:16S rRNA (guanine(527)-N(7))-methyltransferase RsmG [Oceaniglobus indicus]